MAETNSHRLFVNNCPINEETADGVRVGRCWHWLKDGHICPRHGNVKKAVEIYLSNGTLTPESENRIYL